MVAHPGGGQQVHELQARRAGNPSYSIKAAGMRIRHFFPRIRIRLEKITDPNPDPTFNRNEEKYIFDHILGRLKIRYYKP